MATHSKENDTLERFRRTMHAEIRKVAGKYDLTALNVKNLLRSELIKRDIIELSTRELDLKGYAIAVDLLEQWKEKMPYGNSR